MIPAVHVLVLAAGSSSRMNGQDKLVLLVDEIPLLRRVVMTALATGAPVLATLPPDGAAREATIADLPVQIVQVPDPSRGMSRSIAQGLAAISAPGDADGAMIFPADMPGFAPAALSDLIARFRAEPWLIFRGGTTAGLPGHPVIFPRDLWPDLSTLTGDEGGRRVLRANQGRIRMIPLPDPMATFDLDTPADWATWRSRNS